MTRRRAARGIRPVSAFWALLAFALASTWPAVPQAGPAFPKKKYSVSIVVDILRPKFQEVIDGFRQELDARLAAAGAKATYTVFDTKTQAAAVPGILDALRKNPPDLVFAVNSPDAFADRNVSLKLDPSIPVVSENCIPVRSGAAKAWDRPGGSITGVGVFVRMDSVVKLAKKINPKANKLVFFSWDKMKDINEWLEADIRAACAREGVELARVAYLASAEDEFDLLLKCDSLGPDYFGICGISAWVHRDGSYADLVVEESRFVQERIKRFPIYIYDEASVAAGAQAGTCVIWKDLGAQLGEKAVRVLKGEAPSGIPWDYPRKYNIVLNLAAAKRIGMVFPPEITAAAYRIYTDTAGSFVGKKD
jgi:putative tryptophan/tyrosine transport system substrate-binding protein